MSTRSIGRLESQIRLIISNALQTKLSDPRLDRIASITRVELSGDMSFADVYISVMGTDAQQRTFMRGLEHAHSVLQRLVAKNLRTRVCPILRFHLDNSIKQGFETLKLIEKSEKERQERLGIYDKAEGESNDVYDVSDAGDVGDVSDISELADENENNNEES